MAALNQGKASVAPLGIQALIAATNANGGNKTCTPPRVYLTRENGFFPESPEKPVEEVQAVVGDPEEAPKVSYLLCTSCKELIPPGDKLSYHPGFLQRQSAMNWSDEDECAITCNCGNDAIYYAVYTCTTSVSDDTWQVSVNLIS